VVNFLNQILVLIHNQEQPILHLMHKNRTEIDADLYMDFGVITTENTLNSDAIKSITLINNSNSDTNSGTSIQSYSDVYTGVDRKADILTINPNSKISFRSGFTDDIIFENRIAGDIGNNLAERLSIVSDGHLKINNSYSLRNTDGSLNQILKSDGSGTLLVK